MICVYATDKRAEIVLMKALRMVGADKLDVTIHELGCGTILEFGNWTSCADVVVIADTVRHAMKRTKKGR